jgi:hypothetical protein
MQKSLRYLLAIGWSRASSEFSIDSLVELAFSGLMFGELY